MIDGCFHSPGAMAGEASSLNCQLLFTGQKGAFIRACPNGAKLSISSRVVAMSGFQVVNSNAGFTAAKRNSFDRD